MLEALRLDFWRRIKKGELTPLATWLAGSEKFLDELLAFK